MKITKEEVRHITKLSRLHLSGEEIEMFSGQLSAVIEYAEQMNRLDTSGIEPTSHVIPIQNVMRDDVNRPSLPREEALGNAPDAAEKFYRVPKILE